MRLAVTKALLVVLLAIMVAAVLLSGPATSNFRRVKQDEGPKISERVFESKDVGFPAGLKTDFEVRIVSRNDGTVNHRFNLQAAKIVFAEYTNSFQTNFVFAKTWKPSFNGEIDLPIILLRLLIWAHALKFHLCQLALMPGLYSSISGYVMLWLLIVAAMAGVYLPACRVMLRLLGYVRGVEREWNPERRQTNCAFQGSLTRQCVTVSRKNRKHFHRDPGMFREVHLQSIFYL